MDTTDEILFKRVDSKISACMSRNQSQFIGFFDERQQFVINEYVKYFDYSFEFYGGYENAKRKFLAISTSHVPTDYPISTIEFTYRKADKLTHRDFLGSLMGLGLKREVIGDIVVGEGKTYAFVDNSIVDYILSQIAKIGKVGVKSKIVTQFQLPECDEVQPISGTVSSPRLDCFINLITRLSREKSKELIMSKLVTLNYEICQNQSQTVTESDIISVRGYGKFKIDEIGGLTKKGRYHTVVLKYV